ncbi:hypothetical protein [Streptomyces rhizoryzae]|uniref:hypothetical protein n=1 Tax=Streptomyces rhizoryzae TaxID=2932493 RepID=UPI0035567FB4
MEYRLTPMARALHATLAGLVGWAERHRADIVTARATYDATTATTTASPLNGQAGPARH